MSDNNLLQLLFEKKLIVRAAPQIGSKYNLEFQVKGTDLYIKIYDKTLKTLKGNSSFLKKIIANENQYQNKNLFPARRSRMLYVEQALSKDKFIDELRSYNCNELLKIILFNLDEF